MSKEQIKSAIQQFSQGNLTENALSLFKALGYNTERQAPLDRPDYATFKDSFINDQSIFNEEKALVKDWRHIDLLFQLSKEEVLKQTSLFDTRRVDNAVIESYLFFAIELSKPHYTRTELSNITREINRLFPMPVMVLFKHGLVETGLKPVSTLTLSVINRRLHKRDEGKDVLEKVTLIKDIRIDNPHRAHIEILFDLASEELLRKHRYTNFIELHNAWQKTLDTKELNKRFFQELANWFFWAQSHVQFPNDRKIEEKRNHQINLIRLITRLIFVWFLKEKRLVEERLFDKTLIRKMLKDFDPDSEKTIDYYPAILQNLFFGTLNQKMNERGFAVEGSHNEHKEHYGVKTLYRYAALFNISKDEVVKLFKDIPFLNGGLFDCLDKENEETSKVEYVDGFSRNPKKVPFVPDCLFFGNERIVDLTESYGFKKNNEKFRGIIEIFEDYKFTIEENTPIEEEIALDPELLGKVFENLLAYYNPETESTARKQTGSFYTPREIVNYMVDESIIAYLKTQLLSTNPGYIEFGAIQAKLFANDVPGQLTFTETTGKSRWTGKEDELEAALRHLIHYNNDPHPFNEQEVQRLIFAIDHCKILDPACGSGAFPMGVLHKLVYLLGKLDEKNLRWRELQKMKAIRDTEEAFNIGDVKIREDKLMEINETFENNAGDYGRKLYLIENCIYGVDIQAIAVQISKLRFFISLVVDQKEREWAENRGIRPLPNLETKFVAANTLIGLDKPTQLVLMPGEIETLKKELRQVRHQHFEAKSRKEKLQCQKRDKAIRQKIAALLKSSGWANKDADNIAVFDIYDQYNSSPWFDPEWMFGIKDGFDITIGNPPYVRADAGEEHLALRKRIIESKRYETLWEKWDLFIPFIELGYKALKPNGVTTMIVSDAYCHSKYALKSQEWFLRNSRILRLDFLSKIKVFDAGVYNIVYFFQKADGTANRPVRLVHEEEFGKVRILPTEEQQSLSCRAFFPEDDVRRSFTNPTLQLEEICYVCVGMVVNAHEKLAPGAFDMNDLVVDVKDQTHPKAFVEGKHLDRWLPSTNRYLEWGTKRAPALFRRQTFPEIYSAKEKILVQRSPGPDPKACYDDQNLHFTESSVGFIPWHSLAKVRNNSLKKVARYKGEKPLRPDLPMREDLEKTSRRFAIKYLLAVMNSAFAKNFLRANRRSNIHLYPDDWKQLPIPDVPMDKQAPIVNLVDQILAAKITGTVETGLKPVSTKNNVLIINADTSVLEKQIDEMVYALYGLTEEEIAVVETGLKPVSTKTPSAGTETNDIIQKQIPY